jgi:hypothetical protein
MLVNKERKQIGFGRGALAIMVFGVLGFLEIW